ncbi:hypothetical protein ILYODFUR_037594 [Ilyodon furcidens]|uniref:Uncharacterized protein n=1 Tax=Ilyodon furcidens TaxID=33524 RepID=A0ABV0T3H6_9TELE
MKKNWLQLWTNGRGCWQKLQPEKRQRYNSCKKNRTTRREKEVLWKSHIDDLKEDFKRALSDTNEFHIKMECDKAYQ